MQIAPTTDATTAAAAPREPYEGWAIAQLEAAHGDLNAAISELVHQRPGLVPQGDVLTRQLELIRGVRGTVEEVLGHEAMTDALVAARAVLPRVTRAGEVLAALGQPGTPTDMQPLLDDLNAAMDHIEQLLGAVGWD